MVKPGEGTDPCLTNKIKVELQFKKKKKQPLTFLIQYNCITFQLVRSLCKHTQNCAAVVMRKVTSHKAAKRVVPFNVLNNILKFFFLRSVFLARVVFDSSICIRHICSLV